MHEPPATPRSEHERDRDRIVHGTAFRRLVYKTQVFLNHEGDHFRTRLTHSLEVAQLSRSMARRLALNEELVEAIALAHDLGHTPFGHAGQEALAECMREHGGFEHNRQSLRVVDVLEQRYAQFDGLNLTFETREGVLKHCSRRNAEDLEREEPGGVGLRFLQGGSPSLEAQLVNLADEMAYHAHDIDDGLRSGLMSLEQVQVLPLVARHRAAALAAHPALADRPRRWLAETLRRLLAEQVQDLVATTAAACARAEPQDVEAVRALPALAGHSAELSRDIVTLKRLLFSSLYRHPQVMQSTGKGRRVVCELFAAYLAAPGEMREAFNGLGHAASPHRRVADYVAGMTDRFALREHERLTGVRLFDSGDWSPLITLPAAGRASPAGRDGEAVAALPAIDPG